MKILFVSGNQEKLPDAVIPLGLLYVMANTQPQHERVLTDLCFEDDPFTALQTAVEEHQPDVVAISMRNIQNNDYTGIPDNLDYYEKLVATCKQTSAAPVVLGGAGFSIMPADLLERFEADYGISGEGEEAFPKLLTAIENGAGIETIPNVYFKEPDSGKVRHGPPSSGFLDMTTLETPDRGATDHRYFAEYGIDSIQTKRGCPLRCDYCTYPIIEGRKGRLRNADSIVDEMFASIEQNPSINHFFIVDSVFNLPKTHAKKVCRELIDRKWEIPWTCYANPLGFDQEFADLAAAAGCAGMEIGSDSGVNEVLTRLRKGFTTEHIVRLNKICTQAGIPDCHTFILGTEGETLQDSIDTLDFLTDLDPFSAILMIWIDDYESLHPELREQRMELRQNIEQLIRQRQPDQPTWSVPGLELNFSENLFAAARSAGLHGPLWQHIRGPRKLQSRSNGAVPRHASQ